MHIGLIGGIGPAATDFYYRGLIESAAVKNRELDLTIVHADTATLLDNLGHDRQAEQCAIYERLTERLKRAGADCVVVTSIAGHFCTDAFAETSPLPIIDLTQALAAWLRNKGLTKVGLLGTERVMATGMYGKLSPVAVIAPDGPELREVHDAYVALARSGAPTSEGRGVFERAGQAMVNRGAQGVMLGGTDLNAAFVEGEASFPVIDCARIHVDAIAEWL